MASWFESYGERYFQGLDMKNLKMDQAYLNIMNENSSKIAYLLGMHRSCVSCSYSNPQQIHPEPIRVSSKYRYIISSSADGNSSNVLYDIKEEMGEFGVYKLSIKESSSISFENLKDPVNIYFPILTVFLIYAALYVICLGLVTAWKKLKERQNDVDAPETSTKERIKSIDTFRGISITIMIFVNFGAGGYEILDHSVWNGLHLADLVFPWFLWLMGACIPISLMSSFKKQVPNSSMMVTVTKRSLKLFAVGLFLSSGIYLDKLRILGVLQRFGICYFVVTTICIFFMKRELTETKGFMKYFRDIVKMSWCWLFILAIAGSHLLMTFLLTEDNCPRGYLGPGGLHQYGEFKNCTGGAAGYIDRSILGAHIYGSPTYKEPYECEKIFDPEGIFSTFNSLVQVFLGVQAGLILLLFKTDKGRILRWIIWGTVVGLIGGGLCGFSQDDGLIPLNKNMWSLSFTLVTSGLAFVILSLCYFFIDVKKWWNGKPFFFAGMNSILMYIGHEMTGNYFPVGWNINSEDNLTHFLQLLQNVWATGIWVAVSYYLYTIKYFFTL